MKAPTVVPIPKDWYDALQSCNIKVVDATLALAKAKSNRTNQFDLMVKWISNHFISPDGIKTANVNLSADEKYLVFTWPEKNYEYNPSIYN